MKLVVAHSKYAFTPKRIEKIIESARMKLAGIEFDSFAFRGMSGALIASVLAREMKKTLIMVRKESSHSMRSVEGDFGAKRYVIIDDFIESGDTCVEIVREITSKINGGIECAAIALYQHKVAVRNWSKQFNVPVIKL